MKTIKYKRVILNMTQKDLSDLVGVSQAALSKYELGESTPSVKVLKKLAKALNCTVDELLENSVV